MIAERLAREAHASQVDLDGSAHVDHVAAVAAVFPAGSREQEVAWLHDVLEDTDVTARELHDAGISVWVIAAVDVLTRRGGEPYGRYIARVVASGNALALAVKRADLEHNLARSRAGGQLDLARRYEAALTRLGGR